MQYSCSCSETTGKRQQTREKKLYDENKSTMGVRNITLPSRQIWLNPLLARINEKSKVCHCVCTCIPMQMPTCTPFLPSDCARALGAQGYLPKKALCRRVQLFVLLDRVLLDLIRGAGPHACYNKLGHRFLPRFLSPGSWQSWSLQQVFATQRLSPPSSHFST